MTTTLRQQTELAKKIKTRKKLLASAIKVFLLRGYHKTKISDIVAQAEVGQGTFYRYFKTKREIFEELIKKTIEEIVLEFSNGSLNIKDVPKTFEEYVDMSKSAFLQLISILESNKEITKIFLRDASTVDKEFKNEVNEIFEQFILLAKYYLDNAVKKNFIRKCDTRIISELIVAMVVHTIENWLDKKHDNLNIEKVVIESIDFVFLGLKI